MSQELQRELIQLAKIAPLDGFIDSGDFRVINLQEKYNVSRYYVVEILQYLEANEEIRKVEVNYDRDDEHILSYRFR